MTNNQLTENSVNQLLNSIRLARDNAERADNRVDHSFYYALTIALEELQERRKAAMDSEAVAWLLSGGGAENVVRFDSGNAYADPLREVTPLYRHAQSAPEYPETLPCPVFLEPGMRFGKGVKTRLVLEAIKRRAEHYAELEAMTPEERAEYDAGIEAFKAMLPKPVNVSPDFDTWFDGPDAGLRVVNYHIQRELQESAWNACRAAMLQAGNSPVIPDTWIPVSERMPEDEQEVLTINRMGHRFVSLFDKHSGLFFDRLDAPSACCIEHVLVTHWMPLPAAPQEVKP